MPHLSPVQNTIGPGVRYSLGLQELAGLHTRTRPEKKEARKNDAFILIGGAYRD